MIKKCFAFAAAAAVFVVNSFYCEASSSSSSSSLPSSSSSACLYDRTHSVFETTVNDVMRSCSTIFYKKELDDAKNCPYATKSQCYCAKTFVNCLLITMSDDPSKRVKFYELMDKRLRSYEAVFSLINNEINNEVAKTDKLSKERIKARREMYSDLLKDIEKNRNSLAKNEICWLIESYGAHWDGKQATFRTFFDNLHVTLTSYFISQKKL